MTAAYIGTYVGVKGEPNLFFETLGRRAYKVERIERWLGYDLEPTTMVEERRVAEVHEADVISSELEDGRHAPVIDIDIPIRAIPSTTKDHWHLYIEKPMSWWRYRRLLKALVRAGIVEKGYYKASVARRGTHVRLPWVRKPVPTDFDLPDPF